MKLIKFKITDLEPHPKNYNGHPDNQITELENSLETFEGQYKNIVVWKSLIIAGNGLFMAAKRKGLKHIYAVDKSHWTEEKALALLAADNLISEMAEPDLSMLDDIIQGIDFDIPGVTEEVLSGLGIYQKKEIIFPFGGQPEHGEKPNADIMPMEKDKYALSIVVEKNYYDIWTEYKIKNNIKTDSAAFLKLLECLK